MMEQLKRQLLPEQSAAAYDIKKHISVTAGPGSGKTTVLVERYLHILREQNLSIDQIVAITFTNRAANEMRERLRSELNLILRNAGESERRRWLNYKRTLDVAVITTIHGFCARLLREFPVEARVDPQFVLLDEHRAAMLLESIVEQVLGEFINEGHLEISRLTLGVGRRRLAAALAQLYRDVRGQGLDLEKLAVATARVHASAEDHARALADLDRGIADLLAVRRTTPAGRSHQEELSAAWPGMQKLLKTVPSHETLAEYCRCIGEFRDLRPAARSPVADYVRAIDALVWEKDLQGRIPQVCLDLFAQQYALEMVNLLTHIDRRLNEEKQRLSALDFDDLETRTLLLLQRPEVLGRTAERYRFFLVDEFQDTNGPQRELLERLALPEGHRPANLFIVGDRKQSIYGFRGADVDVFRSMTSTLLAAGGEAKPLQLNFRSQPPLIAFFNFLFARLFQVPDDLPPEQRKNLDELGYVKHEDSEPRRELRDPGPLVEFLITTKPSLEDDPKAEQDTRILDAKQLARRILALVQSESQKIKYSDIALLFRAMTQVQIYEAVFRQANIPYQTVLGRGFYEREEITDLIQLLRFLDNKTDEVALAAILRSPLCGISDNALLALRCAPWQKEVGLVDPLRAFASKRPLYTALRRHREIAFIDDEEHALLDRAAKLISRLVARRHHYSIPDLLRFAVDESEYTTIAAANFDGAQRLANIQRLFTLAARFESSGTHLIRDFVQYVADFEAIGSRESEGQIDQAADAVRLMTIHQAKGLEFPVVIIPDLQRLSRLAPDNWVLLDRHQGLTLKVPDGRGNLVAGCTFTTFEKRQARRELFESMRLLYVAATRAQDRLILSGATEELATLKGKNDSWLKWIWQALQFDGQWQSGIVDLPGNAQLQLTINLADEPVPEAKAAPEEETITYPGDSLNEVFPLLRPVAATGEKANYRFGVTQLINYQRCPRQYYFERVLRLPSIDELAVWNSAEVPEPPANLNASLKGAVIHRFCERYSPDQSAEECLRSSFNDVLRLRQAQLADRLVEFNAEAAIRELLPLAKKYLASDVFSRVEAARKVSQGQPLRPSGETGLWSEVRFSLRRPMGILMGVIDKLLITRSPDGSLEVEIVDFKTNRMKVTLPKTPSQRTLAQFAFDFENTSTQIDAGDVVEITAHDYELQMQAYALAVHELMPSISKIRVTLHFLDPNVEIHLPEELLEPARCKQAIDDAMLRIVSSIDPEQFPVKTAPHCRMCSFLRVCTPGKEFIARTLVHG
jgi:ATP-dependent helicase/nuclease subunit A